MEKLIALLKELVAHRFYGELVIKFEAGVVVQCKKTESIIMGERETVTR